jgi:23S rRNA (cytosine1962-C5)-methyltransferase
VRAAEGLPLVTGVIEGAPPPAFRIATPSGSFKVDLVGGQKTGLYLDQFGNYRAAARRAKGLRVLDCFCNQGGFALACALGGAASVTGIDSSAAAIATAIENAAATGAGDRTEFIEANVFDHLKTLEKREAGAETDVGFDHIILDPPSFARSRSAIEDARRGYKEINLRALKLLRPGGFLTTFSCSHHVSRDEFLDVILDAANDARRTLRLDAFLTQNADHPILPAIPESGYLKGFTFEIIAGW